LSLVAAVLAAAALSGPGLANPHPCPQAPGFTCSTLSVPLDRSGQVNGTLRLNVAAANNVKAPRGVLLFLSGGPGQPGVPAIARIAGRIAPVLGDYRLVMIDQRGTGGTAIQCPRLQEEVGSSDIAVPSRGAVRACATSLGKRRSFFATRDTVEDLDDLRAALGVKKLTIDGVSYGTFVAERYALAHPDRVKALVLDSVLPHADPRGDIPFYFVGLRATARVLRAACGSCGFDPAADIAWLVRHGVDGVKLFDLIVAYEFADPDYAGVLSAIHAARKGDRNPLLGLETNVHQASGAPTEFFSAGLHAATLCSDLRFPWGTARTNRQAFITGRLVTLPAQATWPFTPATAAGNGIIATCKNWPETPATPLLATRLPAVPVLLLSGDRDLSTPNEWARQEAALAPKGRLVIVPGASHSIQTRERGDVGRRALQEFLLG
jgi:pimeloyl-ACP methyl ester carboxylesterase